MTVPSYTEASIPPPECPLGYPDTQIEAILGNRLAEFRRWMRGQTVALCRGDRYDHTRREYVPDDCADHPHGMVTYGSDLCQFLAGRRPLD